MVRGTDLEGYKVSAIVQPVFPNEEVRKHAMATQVKDVLSEHTRMEKYLNVKQPDEERKRRIQEQAINHPLMQQYIITTALKELADSGDEAALIVLQQMQQQGQPNGQPGRPADPQAPEQMMGGMGPTGQPTPQEMGGAPPGQSIPDQLDQMSGASPQLLTGGI
jgi:hypothetical protein